MRTGQRTAISVYAASLNCQGMEETGGAMQSGWPRPACVVLSSEGCLGALQRSHPVRNWVACRKAGVIREAAHLGPPPNWSISLPLYKPGIFLNQSAPQRDNPPAMGHCPHFPNRTLSPAKAQPYTGHLPESEHHPHSPEMPRAEHPGARAFTLTETPPPRQHCQRGQPSAGGLHLSRSGLPSQ